MSEGTATFGIDEARKRVAVGAAWLDGTHPGWADKIDVGRLDMKSSCLCVLGQLFRSFWHKASEQHWLESADGTWETVNVMRTSMGYLGGFSGSGVAPAPVGSNLYRLLQDAWIEAIADRVVPVTQPAEVGTPVALSVTT